MLGSVRKTVAGCQHTVTAWGDDEHKTTVYPTPLIPGSPDIAHETTYLSSTTLAA